MGEKETKTWSELPHASFDLVVMNPPFTRPTGHEAAKIGVPIPMFAAFGIDKRVQRAMSKMTTKLTVSTSAHGNAGEASIFLVIVDRKLKVGGTTALVLPVSLVAGKAWEASRRLLRKHYSGLVVVSIAAAEDAAMSFSADTDMGECLIVGRKTAGGTNRATFVSLRERPVSTMAGASAAVEVSRLRKSGSIRTLEEGPVGGTPLMFGSDTIGMVLDGPLPDIGGWNLARVADFTLAQTAYQIANAGRIWLPSRREAQAVPLPVSTVAKVGTIGPYHMDVMGDTTTGGVRGPFKVVTITGGGVPTYPVLWHHDASRERTLAFEAESEGLPRRGETAEERATVKKKVEAVWRSASHCHFNRDFRFNSQSTAVQFSPRKTIGGHAWPSVQLASEDLEKALVVWGNTTFGALMYWWHSNRQHAGRGRIGKAALASLPVLNVAALSPEQIKAAATLFDSMASRPLKPINEIDDDPVRRELDTRFLKEVLGVDDAEVVDAVGLLRSKMAHEPSIRGAKGAGDSDEDDEEDDDGGGGGRGSGGNGETDSTADFADVNERLDRLDERRKAIRGARGFVRTPIAFPETKLRSKTPPKRRKWRPV
jgi:hypothetical protein